MMTNGVKASPDNTPPTSSIPHPVAFFDCELHRPPFPIKPDLQCAAISRQADGASAASASYPFLSMIVNAFPRIDVNHPEAVYGAFHGTPTSTVLVPQSCSFYVYIVIDSFFLYGPFISPFSQLVSLSLENNYTWQPDYDNKGKETNSGE